MKDNDIKVTDESKCQEDEPLVKGSNILLLGLYLLSTYPAYKGGSLVVQGESYGWFIVLAGAVYIALVYILERLISTHLNKKTKGIK